MHCCKTSTSLGEPPRLCADPVMLQRGRRKLRQQLEDQDRNWGGRVEEPGNHCEVDPSPLCIWSSPSRYPFVESRPQSFKGVPVLEPGSTRRWAHAGNPDVFFSLFNGQLVSHQSCLRSFGNSRGAEDGCSNRIEGHSSVCSVAEEPRQRLPTLRSADHLLLLHELSPVPQSHQCGEEYMAPCWLQRDRHELDRWRGACQLDQLHLLGAVHVGHFAWKFGLRLSAIVCGGHVLQRSDRRPSEPSLLSVCGHGAERCFHFNARAGLFLQDSRVLVLRCCPAVRWDGPVDRMAECGGCDSQLAGKGPPGLDHGTLERSHVGREHPGGHHTRNLGTRCVGLVVHCARTDNRQHGCDCAFLSGGGPARCWLLASATPWSRPWSRGRRWWGPAVAKWPTCYERL